MTRTISYTKIDSVCSQTVSVSLIQIDEQGALTTEYHPVQETKATMKNRELGVIVTHHTHNNSHVYCLPVFRKYLLAPELYRSISVAGTRTCSVCSGENPSYKFIKFRSEFYIHEGCYSQLQMISEKLFNRNSEYILSNNI